MVKYIKLTGLLLAFAHLTTAQNFLNQFDVPAGEPKQITETYAIQKGDDTKLIVTTTFTYTDGHIASKDMAYPDPHKNKVVDYNFTGKVPMEVTERNAAGEWTAKYYVNADFSNNISGFKKMDPNYQTLQHEAYKYDGDRMTSYTTYDAAGKAKAVTIFEYNGSGLCVRKVTKRDGAVSKTIDYTYNGKGQVLTEQLRHNEFSYLNYTFTYTYNAQGDMVTTAMNNGDANYVEYTYDDKGNWISKTSWFKNSPDSKDVYTRTITY